MTIITYAGQQVEILQITGRRTQIVLPDGQILWVPTDELTESKVVAVEAA